MTKETVVPGFGRSLRRVGVGVLAATTAASACLGAVVLIARGLSVSAVATASPVWGHPVLAGITLGVVVGAPAIWLAWLTCSGDTRTDAIALLSGALASDRLDGDGDRHGAGIRRHPTDLPGRWRGVDLARSDRYRIPTRPDTRQVTMRPPRSRCLSPERTFADPTPRDP